MTIDFKALDYIAQLQQAGPRPAEQLVRRILGLGDAAVEPLLELATDGSVLYEPPPRAYAPVHALRLLGELGATRVIAPLLAAFPMDMGTDEQQATPSSLWDSELPQILGRLAAGAPEAIQSVWAIADDAEASVAVRSAAMTTLAYATAADPALRDEVVAGLRSRLAASEDAIVAGHLLIALGNIGAPEAYADVMGLYRAGKIDKDVIGAGVARQLLLSSSEKRLACAKHPLWERYDQHGPFPPQPGR